MAGDNKGGEALKTGEAGGFKIREAVFKPYSAVPGHRHDCTVIALNIGGAIRESFKGRSYDCAPGSILLIPRGEVHADNFGADGGHYICVAVSGTALKMLGEYSAAFDRVLYGEGGDILPSIKRIYNELARQDTASRMIIQGLLLEMLGGLVRDESEGGAKTPPRFITDARDYIHQHFAEAPNLADLAGLVGVHPTHLARSFKKHYGCSLGEYVRRRRIEYASLQLSKSDKPLVEIAHEAGFYDQSHFTLVFKQHIQMTPSQFRREARRRGLRLVS